MIRNKTKLSPTIYSLLNIIIVIGSALLATLMMLPRIKGMELLGLTPNWILIWVVAWSINRTAVQAAIAGLCMGMIFDGMTSSAEPTHTIALIIVGVLSAKLQKHRYIKEDFISIALIVFAMVAISESIRAIQFFLLGYGNMDLIWLSYQKLMLTSGILSSLWAPVFYYPLSCWWDKSDKLAKLPKHN